MIRCTRNRLLILVAAFTLTGCMSLAPRMAGPQFTGEIVASAAIAGSAPATEVMITPTRVASATATPTASPTYTMSSTASIQPTATPSATASGSPTPPAPTSTRTPTLTSTPAATVTPEPPAAPSPQPVTQADLVVLGPETRYPVRARVVRGWDYELVDTATGYDFLVHRDVFGMLAHQLDAERVTRYHRPSFFSFTPDGMFRIYLVDWAPHPNAECAARGYGMTALVDFGGDLDQRLVDEHGDGIQIAGVRFQSQPLRFQRDRVAAGKGIEQGRRVAVRGLQDLGPCAAKHFLVVHVLPLHQLLDEPEKALALGMLDGLGGKLLGVAGRVIHDGREDHRTACGQRPSRPPQVRRARVAVSDGLLPRRLLVDGFEGQGDFDEFALVGHVFLEPDLLTLARQKDGLASEELSNES